MLVLGIILIIYFWRNEKKRSAANRADASLDHVPSVSAYQDLRYSNSYTDISDDHVYQDLSCTIEISNYHDLSNHCSFRDQPYNNTYREIPDTHAYQSLIRDKNETKC